MTKPDNPRRCAATNKAGEPCKAGPMKDSDYCSAHNPALPDGARFGSPAQAGAAGVLGGAATRKPRLVEVMRERVEAEVDRILAPYFEALEGAVVTATWEGEVIASDVADLGARIAAAEKLLNRVYGMPRQATELTGAEGGPVAVAGLPDEELQSLAAALAAKRAS